jgi:hypothetical protein
MGEVCSLEASTVACFSFEGYSGGTVVLVKYVLWVLFDRLGLPFGVVMRECRDGVPVLLLTTNQRTADSSSRNWQVEGKESAIEAAKGPSVPQSLPGRRE